MNQMEKGSSSSTKDSLNGLKFGKKIYFEGGSGDDGPPPASSPAKKGRSGAEPPRCQVEGCNVDLSDAKAYYSRHKVCGMHSKASKVIVSGIQQRFCQQCSRFHQMSEFDQGKRSCRRRLAGHNERRRKPAPSSMMSPRYGTLSTSMFDSPSKTGGLVMDFSNYPISWPNATTYERGMGNPTPNILQGSTTRSSSYSNPPRVSSVDCFNRVSNSNNSACSLLSNQPWTSGGQSSSSLGLNVNNFFGTNGSQGSTMVQPSVNHGAPIGQIACPYNSNEMNPDLGLGQMSHSTNSHYNGELGLGQPNEGQFHDIDHSRGYDSSVQHMNWSL